jgi:hypothetical protein
LVGVKVGVMLGIKVGFILANMISKRKNNKMAKINKAAQE